MGKKYIDFYPNVSNKRTLVWSVNSLSSTELLGWVKWYAPWRQYCFFPEDGTTYSAGCLEEINDFITLHKTDRVQP
jgi:hypothetical protein